MSYRPEEHGERGLTAEPLPLSAGPGTFPGFPGGLPGPISRAPGPVGPNMPSSLFPTHTRVGDVVTVTGPFGGLAQGQVRVKFHGARWMSPQIIGPGTASVVVPRGARNGLCEIEVNGRRVWGTNCIVDKGVDRTGDPSHKGRSVRSWRHDPAVPAYLRGDDAPAKPRFRDTKLFWVSVVAGGMLAVGLLTSWSERRGRRRK